MKKMGWNGGGLGEKEHGATACVQIKVREEGKGIGKDLKAGFDWADNWWEKQFDQTISRLKVRPQRKNSQLSKSSHHSP